jgi:hypothetical protein
MESKAALEAAEKLALGRVLKGHSFSCAAQVVYFVIYAGFSPQGICFFDFFSRLFSR